MLCCPCCVCLPSLCLFFWHLFEIFAFVFGNLCILLAFFFCCIFSLFFFHFWRFICIFAHLHLFVFCLSFIFFYIILFFTFFFAWHFPRRMTTGAAPRRMAPQVQRAYKVAQVLQEKFDGEITCGIASGLALVGTCVVDKQPHAVKTGPIGDHARALQRLCAPNKAKCLLLAPEAQELRTLCRLQWVDIVHLPSQTHPKGLVAVLGALEEGAADEWMYELEVPPPPPPLSVPPPLCYPRPPPGLDEAGLPGPRLSEHLPGNRERGVGPSRRRPPPPPRHHRHRAP